MPQVTASSTMLAAVTVKTLACPPPADPLGVCLHRLAGGVRQLSGATPRGAASRSPITCRRSPGVICVYPLRSYYLVMSVRRLSFSAASRC
jgi:hypothetical protein